MTDIDPALREALVKQMWGHRVHVVTPHDAHRVADYLAPFIANAVKAAETAALAERDAARAEVARLRAAVEVALASSATSNLARQVGVEPFVYKRTLRAALAAGGGERA